MREHHPPRWAERLLEFSSSPTDRAVILGDAHDEFQRRCAQGSVWVARWWYRLEVLRSTPPNLVSRLRQRARRRRANPQGDGFMYDLFHDLRYSLRRIRTDWMFSLVVVLTLGVGIGTNSLVYSVVDGAVLNPYPYPEPDRLVGIGSEWPRLSRELGFWETLSPHEYLDVKQQTETLEHVVMWDMGYRSVSTAGEGAEVVFSAFWFDDAFPTLDMRPAAGRGFAPEELERKDAVAVVSYRFWQSRFAGAPDAVGRSILVDGDPYTVIGVMPAGAMIYGTDLWIPMGTNPIRFPRGRRNMQILARIKPSFTLEDVNTELVAISGRIDQEYGAEYEEYAGWRMRAMTWNDVNVRLVRPAAIAMLGAVGFVLLIVCANVASLLLARSASRRKEVAVRMAIGAGSNRILRQLLVESVLLAGLGGVLGIGMTYLAVPLILAAFPNNLPIVIDFSVNARVVAFTAGVSVLSGILFGLAPALYGARGNAQNTLRSEGTGATLGGKRHLLQRILVGAEFAIALALLVQAGLLARSFVRMQAVDVGFDTENILTMRITLPRSRYPDDRSVFTFFDRLTQSVSTLPGVRAAGVGSQYPPITFASRSFAVEGQVYQSDDELPTAYFTMVSDGYLEALSIPVLQGRTFSPNDAQNTPIVAVINEAAARRFFPGDNPVGRRFKAGSASSDSPWVEIVGVVAAVNNRGPEFEPQPEFFANVRQVLGGNNQLFLVVRTERDARGLLAGVTDQVSALDPNQPVYAVTTVAEAYALMSAPRRIGAAALSAFGIFALLLAAAGIYSVVAYGVSERTREIGIRMAIGASGPTVRQMIVRQAMVPVVVGAAAGLALAISLSRALADFLFQVSATDPLAVTSATVFLTVMALAASYIPARRASLLNPTTALRE